MIPDPEERAAEVLKAVPYMTFSTIDENGPWSAGIAHVVAPPNEFLFFSYLDSRHVSALAADSRVSGTLFDTRAKTEDVESIQFAGHAFVDHNRESIERLYYWSSKRDGKQLDAAAVDRHLSIQDPVLVKLVVHEFWVLNQQQYVDSGKDGREIADVSEAFARYSDSL